MRTIANAVGEANNFDAIRLFAAIGVILSHAYPVTEGSNRNEFIYVLSNGQATLGKLCVAVFFIVSGFLITQSFQRSSSLIEYFVNRVLRIVPGLAILIIATCFVLGPSISSETMQNYWSSYLTWRYLGNILIYPGAQKLPGVFENSIYPLVTNASIWTLSYEFTCYIFTAGFGLAFRKAWFFSLLILSFAFMTVVWTYISPKIFVEFASYFLSGVIAYTARRWIILDIRIFLASLIVLCLSFILNITLILAFCVFGSYSIFFLAYTKRSILHNIAKYGDYSYGTYLYAWPVQQILVPYGSTPFINFALSLPLILLLAACSWSIVEKPLLSRKAALSNFLKTSVYSRVRPEKLANR